MATSTPLQTFTPHSFSTSSSSSFLFTNTKNNAKTPTRRIRNTKFLSNISSSSVTVSNSSSSIVTKDDGERRLIDSLLGIQGRGRSVSPQKLKEVEDAILMLESAQGIPEPTSSSLIEGQWRLIFTTRPGTASPIQRTFVGVDTFSVFQEIQLRNTSDPRVSNIVSFSDAVGELKVEAAASIESGQRIAFCFDKAAFSFNFLPFKVPYPVPFRLLGDKAKGWLDTTYLSPTGNIRISRGNKGTTFVLQKKIEPRQKLLVAILTGKRVEEVLQELALLSDNTSFLSLERLHGKWKLMWSSQGENGNWLRNLSNGLHSFKVDKESKVVENLAQFGPSIQLRSRGTMVGSSSHKYEINVNDVTLELGPVKLPLKKDFKIQLHILYIDSKICAMRGENGSVSVHVREENKY